ncbi:pyridoxal-phosphate dependent enzyme domain-containing protein [Phthorimaea operculella]|nr:pyridoxal-phosphate dependent enzyme domain-containing protein [Phthorimaea operculella]
MSRRIEDFDEWCDPDNPRQIKYDDVIEASRILNKYLAIVPLMESHRARKLSIHLSYKMESLQKTGSFKERGILYALLKLPLDKKKIGVVIASLGNEGIAASYYGAKLNIPVIVVMSTSVSLSRQQKCHALGARVVIQGVNLHEAMRYARQIARDRGLTYINGRDHPHVLTGYGTIALEILQELPLVDAIILPVGTGGLAAAVATVVKHDKPECLVYGVQPEATPLFYKTLENETEEPVVVVNDPTMADSINVTTLGTNSFSNVRPFLDKMLLVKEEWISRAVLHMFEIQKLVVEGAGACPLAAILGNLLPELKLKNVVCIMTGGTVSPMCYSRCLERGLSTEGRLVKFRVNILDRTKAQKQLFHMLEDGGYNILRQFQTHRWIQDDVYRLEVELVCMARNLEHALELKRIIERAYRCESIFENEPFNDKRTCPCYVYKDVCIY